MPLGYTTAIRAITSLSDAEIETIVALYLSYYDGADAALVTSDLKTKTEILLLFYKGALVGFTTFELYQRTWKANTITVIYSGDTVVQQAHWGQQALAYAWIRYIGELKRAAPQQPIYWLLIVKGHRTFKYLPAFTKSFYPHWSLDRSDLRALLDLLAEEKFGEYYDAQSGIVAFETSHGHLKEEFAHPRENEKMKPAVRFFLQRNPEYYKGHELACICEFEDTNLRSFTKRILQGYDLERAC